MSGEPPEEVTWPGSRQRRGRLPGWVADIAIAAPLLVIALVSWLVPAAPEAGVHRLAIGLIGTGMALSLLARRKWPVHVFAAVAGLAFVQWLLAINLRPIDLAVLVALYTVAAYRHRRWALAALAVGLLGVVLAWLGGPLELPGRPTLGLLAPAVLVCAVWLIGRNTRTRRAYLAELEERAGRLERERDAQARAAVAEERARIAREMHDVVAHRVGVMVAQADGASYAFDEHPDQARAAVTVIAENGRAALDELRRLLGVLRGHGSAQTATAPQPGLADIDGLAESMRAAGIPLRCQVDALPGEEYDASELAAYRIVQESLTNVLKHAGPGANASVRIRRRADSLEVEVLDEGRPTDDAQRPASAWGAPGHGLIGMRERTLMLNGTFAAGPRGSGGWRVYALLPVGGPGRA